MHNSMNYNTTNSRNNTRKLGNRKSILDEIISEVIEEDGKDLREKKQQLETIKPLLDEIMKQEKAKDAAIEATEKDYLRLFTGEPNTNKRKRK